MESICPPCFTKIGLAYHAAGLITGNDCNIFLSPIIAALQVRLTLDLHRAEAVKF